MSALGELLVYGLGLPSDDDDPDVRSQVFDALVEWEPEGESPQLLLRTRSNPCPYNVDVIDNGNAFYNDAACALLAVGALDDADAPALLAAVPDFSGFRRQLVRTLMLAGDAEGAHAIAAAGPPEEKWVGYREIAAVLADGGDAVAFFALWKHYAASVERDQMAGLKTALVRGVARRAGWQTALALTENKRIGPAFAIEAFADVPEAADVATLSRLFEGPAAGALSTTDELTVLVRALLATTPTNPEQNHPMLDDVVERIVAVDPTTDTKTMRWRDRTLYELWPACGSAATLKRIRKAVRTPAYKRDSMVLPRDL